MIESTRAFEQQRTQGGLGDPYSHRAEPSGGPASSAGPGIWAILVGLRLVGLLFAVCVIAYVLFGQNAEVARLIQRILDTIQR